MTDEEQLLGGYSGVHYGRALQIARNILVIEHALNDNMKDIQGQPPYIVELAGDRSPHEVTKENPAWIWYRNMVKSHSELVEKLRKIVGDTGGTDDEDDGWNQLLNEVRSK